MPSPSAKALGDKYVEFLSTGIRDELRLLSQQVTASSDLGALKVAAAEVMGKNCLEVFLVGEGGFNQIFLLTFADGSEIIARLNGSRHNQDHIQPAELLQNRMLSEAATLKYVRENTIIPVPKVYAVEVGADNPVHTRYILEERILGRTLSECWSYMTSEERNRVVAQVSAFEGQLMQTRFPRIGSILENDGFYVGPLGLSCISPYNLGKDVGPWESSYDLIKAYVQAELELLDQPDAWMSERVKWKHMNGDTGPPPLEYMRTWYRLLLEVIMKMPPDYPLLDEPCSEAPFVLHHQDISFGNIMMDYDDNSRVVGIVDWEGARVVPLWPCVLHNAFLRDDALPAEEMTELRNLRRNIHISHEPAAGEAGRKSIVLRCLFFLAVSRCSVMKSVRHLNQAFTQYIGLWPQAQTDAFKELVAYIHSQV